MAKLSERKSSPLIIADFETAGTDAAVSPVTEFAAVALHPETFQEIARCQVLFKPNFHPELTFYDPDAEKVTGLSQEILEREGLPFAEAFTKMLEFFKAANLFGYGIASKNRATLAKGNKKTQSTKNQCVLSGHNILFDHKFFQQVFFVAEEFGLLSLDYDDFFTGQYDLYGHFIPEMIDTYPLAKTYFSDKDTANHRLSTFANELHVELVGAHRALNDVLSSAEIYRILANKIRSKGGQGNLERVRTEFKF